MKCLLVLVLLGAVSTALTADPFPLSIIHINDFHARFEPTDTSGGACDDGEECIGGYARTVHTVKRLLKEQADKNPVYFNAGDSFQGTLWYNIGRWNVTSQFLNLLPADAMTLGNHEFDHGIAGVVPFLETVNTEMLVANIDATLEPTMQGKYKNSTIIERSGRKIGVIGVILETTYSLAETGYLVFGNETDAVREESRKLKAAGANIIIVISHCGYEVDKLIAKYAADEIDVIVGAHSHTFLYRGEPPATWPDKPRGDYPTEVIHEASGHRVLIVQASAYAKYVGNLTVFFDENGDVVSYEGAPIYMGSDVPQDAAVLESLLPWQQELNTRANRVVTHSRVPLQQHECKYGECNLGNLFTDAMLHAFVKTANNTAANWSNISVALTPQDTFRVPIPAGVITYKQLVAVCPWENKLYMLTLSGVHLLELLEKSVESMNVAHEKPSSLRFMQASGLRVVYNISAPLGDRVQNVRVRCVACELPYYEPLVLEHDYRVVLMEYLTTGKNGYSLISDNGRDFKVGPVDVDALVEYMEQAGPIVTGIERRIIILK